MAAPLEPISEWRDAYDTLRRNIKTATACTILFCVTINLLIYYSFDRSPPKYVPPADPVQRRTIVVPKQLRSGRPNPLETPPSWMSDWVQYQKLDLEAVGDLSKEVVFDLVYTWVNGTQVKLREMKEHYKDLSPMFQALRASPEPPDVAKPNVAGYGSNDGDQISHRYRDMNELKYSFRSVAENAAEGLFRRAHILTTEVLVDQITGEKRGQVPQWLDLEKAKGAVKLVTHGKIYDKEDDLPSFNSLSIESQMHHIPELADIFVYLNDDVFFGKPLGIADFWTPLYGPVLHMDIITRVQPFPPEPLQDATTVGEWHSLQYTNSILSKQFGARYRVYLAHIPHILSVPIMEEMQATWPKEFAKTSSHRFRGEGNALEIQVSFFQAHYIMERARETQLTSYWKYRLDKNEDGKLNWDERQQLIRIIDHYEWTKQENVKVMPHLRNKTFTSSLEAHDKNLQKVGIPWTNETVYYRTGMDDYPFLLRYGDTSKSSNQQHAKDRPYFPSQNQRSCQFDFDFCLGSDFRNSSIPFVNATTGKGSIFERLAFTEFHCGDCLLHIIRQESTVPGLSAIMPLDKDSNAYREVLRDLAKYKYVVGHSDFQFLQLKNGMQAHRSLDLLTRSKDKETYFCINDDVQDNPLIIERVRAVFSAFLDNRFPTASPWEKSD